MFPISIFLPPENEKRGLWAAFGLLSGILPSGLCFAGRGEPSLARQTRPGDFTKIKEASQIEC
jgi:hypothetical protein